MNNLQILAFVEVFLEMLRPNRCFFLDIVYERGEKALFLIVRKEVNSMEQPSFDKTTVEHQYDTLIKKVLTGEAKNARAEMSKRRAYEVNFSDLNQQLFEKIGTCDEGLYENYLFEISS